VGCLCVLRVVGVGLCCGCVGWVVWVGGGGVGWGVGAGAGVCCFEGRSEEEVLGSSGSGLANYMAVCVTIRGHSILFRIDAVKGYRHRLVCGSCRSVGLAQEFFV